LVGPEFQAQKTTKKDSNFSSYRRHAQGEAQEHNSDRLNESIPVPLFRSVQ
jgi:hypothetical protein